MKILKIIIYFISIPMRFVRKYFINEYIINNKYNKYIINEYYEWIL